MEEPCYILSYLCNFSVLSTTVIENDDREKKERQNNAFSPFLPHEETEDKVLVEYMHIKKQNKNR